MPRVTLVLLAAVMTSAVSKVRGGLSCYEWGRWSPGYALANTETGKCLVDKINAAFDGEVDRCGSKSGWHLSNSNSECERTASNINKDARYAGPTIHCGADSDAWAIDDSFLPDDVDGTYLYFYSEVDCIQGVEKIEALLNCLQANNCINGECISSGCKCTSGWGGTSCASNIDDCAGKDCGNGHVHGYKCRSKRKERRWALPAVHCSTAGLPRYRDCPGLARCKKPTITLVFSYRKRILIGGAQYHTPYPRWSAVSLPHACLSHLC